MSSASAGRRDPSCTTYLCLCLGRSSSPISLLVSSERLDASGRVLIEVDDATVDRVAATFRERRPDIVAVCLLHSYANPAHEQRVADRLRAAGWRVSTSSDVLPEYREYERWSTTVVNAYVTPLIDRYLGALESKLGGLAAVDHAIERRVDFRGGRARARRAHGAVGARGRRRRGAGRRGGRGLSARDLVRHGRHVDRCQPHRWRHRDDDRRENRRFSRASAGDRHSHGGGRGRVDCARRHRRRAARGATERRRRAGSGVLRHGHGAHRHGRQRPARPARRRVFSRRPDDARRRSRAPRRRGRRPAHAASACRRSPKASFAWPTPTWSARFAWSPSSAGTIRAISRSSPSAARAACTPARSPAGSTSGP